jgi:hypothetical protein
MKYCNGSHHKVEWSEIIKKMKGRWELLIITRQNFQHLIIIPENIKFSMLVIIKQFILLVISIEVFFIVISFMCFWCSLFGVGEGGLMLGFQFLASSLFHLLSDLFTFSLSLQPLHFFTISSTSSLFHYLFNLFTLSLVF